MRIEYYFWLLLPLAFIAMLIWAFVKPIFGIHGKEDKYQYTMQIIWSVVGFGIAVGVDSLQIFDVLCEWVSIVITVQADYFRWLIYPAVLVLMAQVQRYWKKEDKQRTLPSKYKYH